MEDKIKEIFLIGIFFVYLFWYLMFVFYWNVFKLFFFLNVGFWDFMEKEKRNILVSKWLFYFIMFYRMLR